MTSHIDLGSVLRQTLSADLYSNLVTRPTGAAVRTQIERVLESDASGDRALAIIDFTHVSMIDLSCADEIIAKLVLRYGREPAAREAYFVFRGMTDDHWDSIETVLERHGLAIVADRGGGAELLGVLGDRERRAWESVRRFGRATTRDVAADLRETERDAGAALDALWRRRLIMRFGDAYMPVGEVT